LMQQVLQRFFTIVSVAVLVILGSGLWMIGRVAKQSVQAGAGFSMPLDWTVMTVVGLLMMALYGHIRFVLFKRLSRAVSAQQWSQAASAQGALRTWVGVNLALGLALVVVVYLL